MGDRGGEKGTELGGYTEERNEKGRRGRRGRREGRKEGRRRKGITFLDPLLGLTKRTRTTGTMISVLFQTCNVGVINYRLLVNKVQTPLAAETRASRCRHVLRELFALRRKTR
jgi:hypothetical protein